MNIKQKLKGGFDLLFLFGRGITAFEGTKASALKSFLIPLALIPIDLFVSTIYPPPGLDKGFDNGTIVPFILTNTLISFTLSIAFLTGIAFAFKQFDRLWLFLEAANWTGLAATIVTAPLTLSAVYDWLPRAELDRANTIVLYYTVVCVNWCIANKSFKLNWQLAGFIAMTLVFTGQTAQDLTFKLFSIATPMSF